jgi:hypothetical protein
VTVGGGWRKWAAQATGQQIADGWMTSRRARSPVGTTRLERGVEVVTRPLMHACWHARENLASWAESIQCQAGLLRWAGPILKP